MCVVSGVVIHILMQRRQSGPQAKHWHKEGAVKLVSIPGKLTNMRYSMLSSLGCQQALEQRAVNACVRSAHKDAACIAQHVSRISWGLLQYLR